MKKIIAFMLFFGITSMAAGEVSTRVCLSDGSTPLELADPCIPFVYRDVMVETKLTIIVSSDVAEEWYGGALVTEDTNILYGRDCNGYECPGSCLPAAGDFAYVVKIEYPGFGFDFYGGEDPDAGDWFIIDYNAVDTGYCNVEFYNYDVSTTEPLYTLIFNHVRPDLDQDTKVDFNDYAILASHWLQTGCNEPGWCQGADLDIDGNVDFNDLRLFCEFWLEKAE
ncbi:MAG: hypothetical protein PHQ35_08165 [Phycisphaerae bacterium]|nr:hypothetical protein [Phycisphaerae bacterium]MDD5380136.1 hypothetical protein [Phycisphaerae bacterium]